jgi:hypothetical protein
MPTLCPSCRRRTRTIHGVCPQCGEPKEGGPPLRRQKLAQGDPWGRLDDLFFWSLSFAPGLALIILALVFVASDLLLLAGLLLLLVPVGMKLLGDAEQP